MDELAAQLRQHDAVEAAYVKPPGEPPLLREHVEQLNAMQPRTDDAPPSTPDFSARQIYLNAAPEGIDARYAWTLPGGTGAGVNIIDLEWSWRFTHEDLAQNQGGVVAGLETGDHGRVDDGWAHAREPHATPPVLVRQHLHERHDRVLRRRVRAEARAR